MKTAITKAIEGGYNQSHIYPSARKGYVEINQALLDPSFWQCLGKSLGWDEGKHRDELYEKAPHLQWMWQFKWHKFIDHIAEGGDVESFFKKLLKQ